MKLVKNICSNMVMNFVYALVLENTCIYAYLCRDIEAI